MKNTSMKKKALLSSVAMLLVAIVALGSATFAWFTSSATLTAGGINVKTIKASELQISSATGDWGDTIDYGVSDKILKPVSSGDGLKWFKADAASKSSYVAKADTVAEVATGLGSYVFADQLNVKNNGGASVENVQIQFEIGTATGSDPSYLRIALVEAGEKGAGKAFTGTWTESIYDTAGAAYLAYTSTTETASITPSTTYTIDVGTLAASAAKYYNLYVWYEGQDEQCVDANAGASIPDITFTISGSTVSQ